VLPFLNKLQGSRIKRTGVASALKTFLALQGALVILCFASELFCRYVLHLGAPFDYPLKAREQSQFDFVGYWTNFEYFRQSGFFTNGPPFLYPAPIAIAYWVFYAFPHHHLRLFLSFILASFLVAALLLGRALVRRGVRPAQAACFLALSLTSAYPLWFELKQGNIEICVWVFVALGVWALVRLRTYTAAACFGIAGAMKFFPLVYLGLLLAKRRYCETLFALGVAAITTVASVWFVGPNFIGTWRQIDSGLNEFRTTYILHLRLDEIGFDHSLFGLYKRLSPQLPPVAVLTNILTLYLALTAVAGMALYFVRIQRLPMANQLLCLSIASILLPPVSYDYTLMHIYIPWALLALYAQGKHLHRLSVPGLTAAFVCLAILVSPETEFIYRGTVFGGQIKAVVLIVLMGIGLRYPFTEEAAAELL
jgi:hypothetical protein